MDIEVASKKLKAAVEDDAVCQKVFGKPMARFIRLRVDALHAARCLHDFWPPKSKPERVHALGGKLQGIFSIDVKQPYRLLFESLSDEVKDADEQDRWRSVTKIKILRIEDTHG